ncbi:MAG: hypothetical protein NT085_03670 [candidate division SR1 bacterium]|nr:hypothetical protein [candidate division SR1 bacterium]
MILFDPLYDVLVSVFTEHQKLSTQELHTHINKKISISLPNLYKVIRKLLDDQILIKESGKLSLHSRRIAELYTTADTLRKVYVENSSYNLDLKEGEIINFQANNIKDIDGIRGDVCLNVHRLYDISEPMYIYHAHPYYALGMYDTEMTFFTTTQKNTPVYLLFSDTGFLDTYGAELYKKAGMKNVAISKKHPFLQDGYCLNIIGEYIFEFIYPKAISEYFKVFFSSTHEAKQFNKELFGKIFEMKGECKITLRRSKKDADMFKKEIKKYFK